MKANNQVVVGNEQEKRWDMRAHEFNQNQLKSKQKLPKQIVEYLMTHYPSIQSVMDVGGGSGRYALLFSEHVNDILMTDISGNMLQYAAENARRMGKDNIRFIKVDFEAKSIKEITEEHFDLVYASMCPVTRTNNGIDKMMAFSKAYCAIHQFTKSQDSFIEQLKAIKATLGIAECNQPSKQKADPHNDRDSVLRIFTHLWSLGYQPQIQYFSEVLKEPLDRNGAYEKYREHLAVDGLNEDVQKQWTESVDQLLEGKAFEVVKSLETAVIVWSVKEDNKER